MESISTNSHQQIVTSRLGSEAKHEGRSLTPIQAIATKSLSLTGPAQKAIEQQLTGENMKENKLSPNKLSMVVTHPIGQQKGPESGVIKFITDGQVLPGQLLTLLMRNHGAGRLSIAHFINHGASFNTHEQNKIADSSELTRLLLPLNLPRTKLLFLTRAILDSLSPQTNLKHQQLRSLSTLVQQYTSNISTYSDWINTLKAQWGKTLQNLTPTQIPRDEVKAPPRSPNISAYLASRAMNPAGSIPHQSQTSIHHQGTQHYGVIKQFEQLSNDMQRAEFQLLRDTLLSTNLTATLSSKNPRFDALIRWLRSSNGTLNQVSQTMLGSKESFTAANLQAERLSKLHRLLMSEWQPYQTANHHLLKTHRLTDNLALDQLISQVLRLRKDTTGSTPTNQTQIENIKAFMIRASLGSLAMSYLNQVQPTSNTLDDYLQRLIFCQLPLFSSQTIEQVTLAVDKRKPAPGTKKKPIKSWLIHLGFSLTHAGTVTIEISIDERLSANINIWSEQTNTLKYIKSQSLTLIGVYSKQGVEVSNIAFYLGTREVPRYAKKTTQLSVKT